MLKQMKNMIDGALEGAIDRRLIAMGVSFATPKSHTNPYPSEGEKGSNGKENQKYVTHPVHKSKSKKVIQDLATRLPEMQEKGRFTDYESSEDEAPHDEPVKKEDTRELV